MEKNQNPGERATTREKPSTDKETQSPDNIHDKFFWDIFKRPENASGFLRDLLPPAVTDKLDLSNIKVDKKSYLSEAYKSHYSDIVIKTSFKGEPDKPVYAYFLLEHKSDVPALAPLQLLRYMVEQWYDLEKKKLLQGKLPPIIPVIIYQGKKKWTPSTRFQDLVDIPVNEMSSWIPDFRYILNDTTCVDESVFKTSLMVMCWHTIVKYLDRPELRDKLDVVLHMMLDILEHNTVLEHIEIIMKYLANTKNRFTKEDAVAVMKNLLEHGGDEMVQGWAKDFFEDGKKEGREEGREEESREMLLSAVQAKYNVLRDDIVDKISKIKSIETARSLLKATFQIDNLDEFGKLLDQSLSTGQ